MRYKVNTSYKIINYGTGCPASYKSKLLSLGFLPGKIFEIKRKALFGGPCQIKIRNADISIRIKELDLLSLEEVKL